MTFDRYSYRKKKLIQRFPVVLKNIYIPQIDLYYFTYTRINTNN